VASMPHLSQLQRDYKDKDVTVIAMTKRDPNNSLQQVKQMVEDKGDGMDYTVAFDQERTTYANFMDAAKKRGIPTCFLVDKSGKIAWIGHPANADIPIAKVVEGSWDYEKGPAMMKAISEARMAIYTASAPEPQKALELLVTFKADYPLAARGLDELHFSILARLPAHKVEAAKLGRKLVDEAIAAENPMALNSFAWNLVDPEASLENRFLDLAMLAANKANAFTDEKDGAILDTVARVYFWKGNLKKAIEIQKSAVENAIGPMKPQLRKALEEYEKALGKKRAS